MRLIKRLIELAFVIFIISLFMKNKDVELTITYFGLAEPIKVAFWELVTFCVSVGIIVAALGDFITQLKWIGERRRMIKTHQEHQGVVDGLNKQIEQLQAETTALQRRLTEKTREAEELTKEVEGLRSQAEAAPSDKSSLESGVPDVLIGEPPKP
ncbi:MAG: hypothetical protein LDL33_03860 [Desulfomonile sp.]|nr:hypothetical protein [Desulfomonile sp.]